MQNYWSRENHDCNTTAVTLLKVNRHIVERCGMERTIRRKSADTIQPMGQIVQEKTTSMDHSLRLHLPTIRTTSSANKKKQ